MIAKRSWANWLLASAEAPKVVAVQWKYSGGGIFYFRRTSGAILRSEGGAKLNFAPVRFNVSYAKGGAFAKRLDPNFSCGGPHPNTEVTASIALEDDCVGTPT